VAARRIFSLPLRRILCCLLYFSTGRCPIWRMFVRSE
jgi:hypothetical protein